MKSFKQFLQMMEAEPGLPRFPQYPTPGKWTIVRRDGKVETPPRPTFDSEDDAQKHLMQKMFSNHHLYKVVQQ